MADKVVRFVEATDWPRVYEAGDIASFDADTAYSLIQRGVAVDHTLDTAGSGGTPLISTSLGGRITALRDEEGEAGIFNPQVLANDEGAVAKGAWPYSPSLPGSDPASFGVSGSAAQVVSGSAPGGGPNNTADFTDPNNAYLVAL